MPLSLPLSVVRVILPTKKAVLSVLADYEERSGLLPAAEKHYSDAAYADSAARDDGFLLDSARCALSSGDLDQANGLVRAVLVSSFDDEILLRARIYAVWIQLASGDRAAALSQLRAFAGNPLFAGYAPALLFTVWWADGDEAAKKSLLDSYAGSPEAAVARGDMSLGANPFWFFMDRNDASVSAFADAGNTSLAKTSPVTPQKNAPVADKPPRIGQGPCFGNGGFCCYACGLGCFTGFVISLPEIPEKPRKWLSIRPLQPERGGNRLDFSRIVSMPTNSLASSSNLAFPRLFAMKNARAAPCIFPCSFRKTLPGTTGNRLKDAGFETFLLIE